MDKISKIIREEIEKYVLMENVGNIGQYIQILNDSVNQLNQYDITNSSGDEQTFISNLIQYVIKVIAALKRCVNADSLNETFSLRDYGIQFPQELGGNFWNDVKRGYQKTNRFLNGFFGNEQNASGYANGSNGQSNVMPSEKLEVLLQQVPQYEEELLNIDTTYNLSGKTQTPQRIIYDLKQLATYYNALKAQGNP